ncbi:hypothetical protein BUALT_Bualt18G0088900 [Buddleja alternifolia]|uniref:Arabidopsis retrotransposon Orf1 C-terminal domain-containing protein n=1 Tax=Buddleja alternifolia TaxID=168488 RepID=A0AAV6WEC7_9LAMI|nr:hypothetical protein BUALT_Bualt18G0088900 [Buddleja alternifolia]
MFEILGVEEVVSLGDPSISRPLRFFSCNVGPGDVKVARPWLRITILILCKQSISNGSIFNRRSPPWDESHHHQLTRRRCYTIENEGEISPNRRLLKTRHHHRCATVAPYATLCRRSGEAPPLQPQSRAQQSQPLFADPSAAPPDLDAATPPPTRSSRRVTTASPWPPDSTAIQSPLPLVIAFSTEKQTTTSKPPPPSQPRLPCSGNTTAAPPPVADHADPPRSSSPTISSGSSSSSHSTHHSPPQWSRLGMGKSVLPSSSKFGGYTTFKSKIQKTRYTDLCRYPIILGKFVDFDTLDALHIRDEFVALVDGIGWSGYFHVKPPAFIELTREFYTTFKFNKPKDLTLTSPGVVKFRLMGKEFSYSINQFNVALGFVDNEYAQTDKYKNSSCDYLRDFRPISLWNTISTNTTYYHPSQSKSSYLREPILKYIQRFLAYNYSGRKDSSGTFTKGEFYFIWCMQNKIKVNLGIWLATQFQSASNKKRLILGSYITQLVVSLKSLVLSNTNMHIVCHMEPLDIDCLHRMGIVTLNHKRATFTSPGPTLQPKKRKCRNMEGSPRDTTSSTPETSNMPSFPSHFENQLNRIESKLDRILAHFHIPPD